MKTRFVGIGCGAVVALASAPAFGALHQATHVPPGTELTTATAFAQPLIGSGLGVGASTTTDVFGVTSGSDVRNDNGFDFVPRYEREALLLAGGPRTLADSVADPPPPFSFVPPPAVVVTDLDGFAGVPSDVLGGEVGSGASPTPSLVPSPSGAAVLTLTGLAVLRRRR